MKLHRFFNIVSIALLVTACGGGGSAAPLSKSSQTVSTPSTPAQVPAETNNISYSDVTSAAFNPPEQKLFYGEDALQFVEYWPSQKTSAALFVIVHGGCWSNSYRINQTYPLATAINLNTNYAVLSIEYRALGDEGGGWPGSYQDVIDALNAIPTFAINTYDTIVLAGHSAGGHLAILAATETELKLSAVIGLAAIVDIEKYSAGDSSCEKAAKSFLGGSFAEIPYTYGQANPVGRTLPTNLHLLYGEQDNIVPVSHAESSGLSFEVIANAGHFDWLFPDSSAFNYLINLLNTLENN